MNYKYKLTKKGRAKVSLFLKNCRAYRKELLDAKKDTARDTRLPNRDAILEDVEFWDDGDGIYNNSWGVTDHYDLPLELIKGQDFIEDEKYIDRTPYIRQSVRQFIKQQEARA